MFTTNTLSVAIEPSTFQLATETLTSFVPYSANLNMALAYSLLVVCFPLFQNASAQHGTPSKRFDERLIYKMHRPHGISALQILAMNALHN